MHGIGIIGLGLMGQRFAKAADAHPNLEVVAAYDPREDHCAGLAVTTGNAQSVIEHPATDCIYIASPPATHRELIERAAHAGKAIFCEKPLSTVPHDAHAAVYAAAQHGVRAAVNFPHATATAATELQRIIKAGDIGAIVSAKITLRFSEWPRRWQNQAGSWLRSPSEGGFSREVLSHFIFLAGRLFGPGNLCDRSVEWDRDTERALCCVFDFNGVKLLVDGAVEGMAEDHNQFEIIGEKAEARLFDWYSLSCGPIRIEGKPALASQVDELAKMLNGEDHRLASLEEACAVTELIEAVVQR